MEIAISRHLEASHLNSIVNHPDVYRWMHGTIEGPLDFAPAMESPHFYALLGEHGGQLYTRIQSGLFDVHSQFKPEGRGEWAIEATRRTLHWVFTRTEAVECVTKVPHGNVPAKALAKGIGGTHEMTIEKGWVLDGKIVPADLYSLTIQHWLKTAPGLVEKGQWFTERFHSELARHGVTELPPSEETAERYIGAAWDMIVGGQPHKAEVFFNRYAYMAGQVPIFLIKPAPLTIAIGPVTIEVRDGDFTVSELPPTN